jgi:hypothetical protein
MIVKTNPPLRICSPLHVISIMGDAPDVLAATPRG